MTDVEANKALVERYLEMWNTGDEAIADEILADDWQDHNHPEVASLEDVKTALLATRKAYPDFHITPEAIIGERNVVALRALIHRAGNTSKVVWFVRVEDGKMAELWTVAEPSH